MEHTLTCMEKMDKLLDETEDYIKCYSNTDDVDLKNAYEKLARCHWDGYENMRRAAEAMVDRKSHSMPDGSVIKKMADWHLDKYDERAHKIKQKMDKLY